MKTITQFAVLQLKNVSAKIDELKAGGKTPEELSIAIGEEFKVEGDKLKLLLNAVDVFKPRAEGLKRIIVSTAAEGEKVPPRTEKRDEHYFLCEFFPMSAQATRDQDRARGNDRDDRGGRGGNRGGGRGGDRDRGGGGKRGGAPGGRPGGFGGGRDDARSGGFGGDARGGGFAGESGSERRPQFRPNDNAPAPRQLEGGLKIVINPASADAGVGTWKKDDSQKRRRPPRAPREPRPAGSLNPVITLVGGEVLTPKVGEEKPRRTRKPRPERTRAPQAEQAPRPEGYKPVVVTRQEREARLAAEAASSATSMGSENSVPQSNSETPSSAPAAENSASS